MGLLLNPPEEYVDSKAGPRSDPMATTRFAVAAPAGIAPVTRPKNALADLASTDVKYRVLVADDHSLFRAALVECVRRTIRVVEIVEAWDLATLQAALTASTEFDLLLLNLNIAGVNGLSTMVHAQALSPGIAVIVVSDVDEFAFVRRAIALGAAGFIAKSSLTSAIAKALTTVLSGGISIPESDAKVALQGTCLSDVEVNAARRVSALTPQQYRIATLLNEGKRNKQIAWELDITETAVKAHISSISQELRVRTRTQVALLIQMFDFERSSQM